MDEFFLRISTKLFGPFPVNTGKIGAVHRLFSFSRPFLISAAPTTRVLAKKQVIPMAHRRVSTSPHLNLAHEHGAVPCGGEEVLTVRRESERSYRQAVETNLRSEGLSCGYVCPCLLRLLLLPLKARKGGERFGDVYVPLAVVGVRQSKKIFRKQTGTSRLKHQRHCRLLPSCLASSTCRAPKHHPPRLAFTCADGMSTPPFSLRSPLSSSPAALSRSKHPQSNASASPPFVPARRTLCAPL